MSINNRQPSFLKAAKRRGYICPVCGNGSGEAGDGIIKAPDGTHWHCFKCGLHADVIDLFGKAFGIRNYSEILSQAAAYFGEESVRVAPRVNILKPAIKPKDFLSYYRLCNSNLAQTKYHKRRGLSESTCNRFLVGYDPYWKHPKASYNVQPSPRLIIPITRFSYLARDTRDVLSARDEQYKKSKVKGAERVSWIFNAKALQTATKPIYVVEGEIDAMSIIEVGGEAVAIGSAGYTRTFLQAVSSAPPDPPLIIALDNDAAGEQAARELQSGLQARGITFYRHNPAQSYKDANAALMACKDELAEQVARGELMAI